MTKPRTGGRGLWRWTPTGVEPDRQRDNPLRRPCPYCGAGTGEPCTRPARSHRRPNRRVHPARQETSP